MLTPTNGSLISNSNTTPSSTTSLVSTNSTTTPVLSPSSNYNSTSTAQQHSANSAITSSISHQQQQQQQLHLLAPTTLTAIPSPYHATYKDTRWLTLEVCREFQRNKCNRSENECKFAHPPAHVEVTNGKVIACYDSLKVSFSGLFVLEFKNHFFFLLQRTHLALSFKCHARRVTFYILHSFRLYTRVSIFI